MELMSLEEYEEIKGSVKDKQTAFAKGQIVVFAYMADCLGSPAFSGMEFICRKIERERKNGRVWK
mgnify:CR=1 FL=1